jgi:putative intracellular protease/amidase
MSHKNLNPVDPAKPKRIAIVISNPGISTTTGWPVGFWWGELSHPFFYCTEAGYDAEIFSPDGGKCEADAMSDPEDASQWQALWKGFAIRDGNLITGQQNFSGGETARLLIETVGS